MGLGQWKKCPLGSLSESMVLALSPPSPVPVPEGQPRHMDPLSSCSPRGDDPTHAAAKWKFSLFFSLIFLPGSSQGGLSTHRPFPLRGPVSTVRGWSSPEAAVWGSLRPNPCAGEVPPACHSPPTPPPTTSCASSRCVLCVVCCVPSLPSADWPRLPQPRPSAAVPGPASFA